MCVFLFIYLIIYFYSYEFAVTSLFYFILIDYRLASMTEVSHQYYYYDDDDDAVNEDDMAMEVQTINSFHHIIIRRL